MDKKAETGYPVHDLIAQRWSPRAFADRAVPDEALGALLEAARWAPSCYNDQPWEFLIARREQPEEFERLLGCLVEANQVWARKAPLLMISVARTTFARNGKPNRHAFHDVGLAVANMTVQATALGLSVHQMGGIDIDRIKSTFGIPEGFEPVAGIAIGHAGDPQSLPEKYRSSELAPRDRKPMAGFTHRKQWGGPAGI